MTGNQDSGQDNRRSEASRSADGRRVVPRVSVPPLRESLKQIQFCLRFLLVLLGVLAAYTVVSAVRAGEAEKLTAAIFVATMICVFGAFLFRVHQAAKLYLENESAGNLESLFESQLVFWFATSFLAFIGVVVHFIF